MTSSSFNVVRHPLKPRARWIGDTLYMSCHVILFTFVIHVIFSRATSRLLYPKEPIYSLHDINFGRPFGSGHCYSFRSPETVSVDRGDQFLPGDQSREKRCLWSTEKQAYFVLLRPHPGVGLTFHLHTVVPAEEVADRTTRATMSWTSPTSVGGRWTAWLLPNRKGIARRERDEWIQGGMMVILMKKEGQKWGSSSLSWLHCP